MAQKNLSIDPAELMLLTTIADTGSLTGAAGLLGTSQSALSKRIRRLEQALGVAVLERKTRGVGLTEFGTALLPRARAIGSQAQRCLEDIARIRGAQDGIVRVALSHFATLVLLPEVLSNFRRHWPSISLHILPPAFHLSSLREGKLDFAVIASSGRCLDREFVARPVYSTTLVVVMRKAHPLAHASDLHALQGAEWILPEKDSATARLLSAALRKARLPAPKSPVLCETLTGIEMVLLKSDLVSVIPAEAYEMHARTAGLVRAPIRDLEGPNIVSIKSVDMRLTPAAKALEAQFVKAGHGLALRTRGHQS